MKLSPWALAIGVYAAQAHAQAPAPVPLVPPLVLDPCFAAPPELDPREIEPPAPEIREPRYGRAALEMVGALGVGAAWYWLNKDVNSRDWEYSTFSSRLTLDAIRFDNNSFATNHLFHTAAGANYHALSRANGLSLWLASLYTVGASTVWEGVLEFKEKVSINDQVTTSLGGVAVGESLFQVSEYVTSAPRGGTGWHRAAGWLFGLPVALHNAVDGRVMPDGPTDNLGLSRRFWHRFEVTLESTRLTSNRPRLMREQGLRVAAAIVNMPGYLGPRRMRRVFWNGNFTEVGFRLAREGLRLGEVEVQAETVAFGVHHQDLTGAEGDLEGVAAMLGVSLGFEHMQRRGLGPFDRMALVHLPGLVLDLRQAFGDDRWLRIRTGGHFEFAAMHALAWPAWRRENPAPRTKSVLEDQQYAYYGGVTTLLLSTFAWGGFEVGGSGRYGFYDSIEGSDREQELLEADLATEEDLIEHHAWVGWNFGEPAVQLRLSVEDLLRRGRAGGLGVVARDTRAIGAVGYVF